MSGMNEIRQKAAISHTFTQADEILQQILTGQVLERAPVLQRAYEEFDPQQRQVLDVLAAYSPQNIQIQRWTTKLSEMAQKQSLVKQNLVYLTSQQIVHMNDVKHKQERVSYHDTKMIVSGSFVASLFYGVILKAPTKSIVPVLLGGTACGLVGAYAYYRYYRMEYDREINNCFLRIVERKLKRGSSRQY